VLQQQEGEEIPSYWHGIGWLFRNNGSDHNWWHLGSLHGSCSLLVRTSRDIDLCWCILFNKNSSATRYYDPLIWKGIYSVIQTQLDKVSHLNETSIQSATNRIYQFGVPFEAFSILWDRMKSLNYRPSWHCPITTWGKTVVYPKFVKNNTQLEWVSYLGLNSETYQQTVHQRSQQGFRVANVESFLQGTNEHYAVVFLKNLDNIQWFCYHKTPWNDHVAQYQKN